MSNIFFKYFTSNFLNFLYIIFNGKTIYNITILCRPWLSKLTQGRKQPILSYIYPYRKYIVTEQRGKIL